MTTLYNKTALKKIKKDDLIQMFLDQQAKMNACVIENQELQDHYDNSIHTDWIAEKAGEDPEYYRDVCCADTLGAMIKENKDLKEENEKLKKANKKYHMQCLKLNRELGDWHRALNEDVEGLEHLQSEINLHFWKRCHGPWDADIEKINQN